MIDTLLKYKDDAFRRPKWAEWGDKGYVVMTVHRPANVDTPEAIQRLKWLLNKLQHRRRIIFPMHPRTRRALDIQLEPLDPDFANVLFVDPMPYLDFINLVGHAELVITDSGGLQAETTALGVPCLTERDNTERPITCALGTNRVVGTNTHEVYRSAIATLIELADEPERKIPRIPMWDGHAAERIVQKLREIYT